jgi:hypothetical protein
MTAIVTVPYAGIYSGRRAVAVTKSDTTDLGQTVALYVGGTGNLAVMMMGDTSAVTFMSVPAGTWLWLTVSKVMSTNTTATNVVAVY